MSKLRIHLLPRFGNSTLDAISFRDIQSYHAQIKLSHCSATANRHLSLLSKMFSCAVQWDILTRNPCKGIAKFTENNVGQRFLSVDEIRRLFGDSTEPTVMALLRTLVGQGLLDGLFPNSTLSLSVAGFR